VPSSNTTQSTSPKAFITAVCACHHYSGSLLARSSHACSDVHESSMSTILGPWQVRKAHNPHAQQGAIPGFGRTYHEPYSHRERLFVVDATEHHACTPFSTGAFQHTTACMRLPVNRPQKSVPANQVYRPPPPFLSRSRAHIHTHKLCTCLRDGQCVRIRQSAHTNVH
jgi:hypothetical protein